MDFRLSLAIGLMCGVFGAEFARADDKGPMLVIPGRPGIPVVINGYDASTRSSRAIGVWRGPARSRR